MSTGGLEDIGSLGVFPRELRDNIYQFYFVETYLVCGTRFWDQSSPFFDVALSDDCSNESESEEDDIREKVFTYGMANQDAVKDDNGVVAAISREPTHLSLLRVCKRLSNESLEILYGHKVFRSASDLQPQDDCALAACITDRMMNVELYLDMSNFNGRSTGQEFSHVQMDAVAGKLITVFAAKSILRRNFRVKFWSCTRFALERSLEALFRALKSLTDFATVYIAIEASFESGIALSKFKTRLGMCGQPSHPCPSRIPAQWFSECMYPNGIQPAKLWLDGLRRALEPAFGTGTVGDVPGAHDVIFARCLTFHPWHFHAPQQVNERNSISGPLENVSLLE